MVHKCLSFEKTIKQLEYMHKTWRKYLWVLALQNGKINCAIRNYAKNEGATSEISTQIKILLMKNYTNFYIVAPTLHPNSMV